MKFDLSIGRSVNSVGMPDDDDKLVPLKSSVMVCVHTVLYTEGHESVLESSDDAASGAVSDSR